MTKKARYAIAVLVLIGAGAGLKWNLIHRTTAASSPVTGSSAVEISRKDSVLEVPKPHSSSSTSNGDIDRVRPPPVSHSVAQTTARSNKPFEADNERGNSKIVEADSLAPDSVVGLPFPISASVEDRCKELKQQGLSGKSECDWVRPFLLEMAGQPRDPIWADKAEMALRKLLTAEEDKYAIRNLECRTSVCVVEYSALAPQQLFPSYEFERDNGLNEEMRMFAHETDPEGNRLIITVLPFTRKR